MLTLIYIQSRLMYARINDSDIRRNDDHKIIVRVFAVFII